MINYYEQVSKFYKKKFQQTKIHVKSDKCAFYRTWEGLIVTTMCVNGIIIESLSSTKYVKKYFMREMFLIFQQYNFVKVNALTLKFVIGNYISVNTT